jgi:AraC family transcriptional regulator
MQVRGALSAPQQARLRRYIEDRLHEDLSVSDLADLCGLRPRHFSTLFRRAFGQTPYRYVIDRRLARGADLLTTSSCDVDEIALRLGFASASHFTSEFRRLYQTTPRRYAREQAARSFSLSS